ncbi:hypothetical protein ACLKMY_35685 [Paraburkholderia mimosarum]|uniref:hypothetical protein n=1 Tax=Paraburkholderia mimosarum TaxID=312026 RepID=UPI0039C01707
MSTPWLPSYFGSWDEFLNALRHNPFLGGDDPRNRRPHLAMRAEQPVPNPWRVAGPEPDPWSPPTSFLISVIGLTQVARQMPEGQIRSELSKSAERAIADFVDGCGTPTPGHPWPWPVPHPWVLTLVSELGIVAQSFDGAMREDVLQVAGQIVQKSFSPEVTG